jgi:glutamate N-acetyltransferase/amino-acid N-acetyltransferase
LDAVSATGEAVGVESSTTGTGVTAARGFMAAGVASGIKADGKRDLSLLVCEESVPVAGVFTTSLAEAPPVTLDRTRVANGRARAIVVNSGCANAGTGEAGYADAVAVGAAVAGALGCAEDEVLVCSTGVIGPRLPVDRITAAIPDLVGRLGSEPAAAESAARGIMTTDSVPKQAVARGAGWVVGGMAKGAGMLRPDMATMLAFLTTDAIIDRPVLQDVLAEAVQTTFNCLNVDGCQSTNDTVLLLASGASGVPADRAEFADAVESVCAELALQMARDAEGASKVVTIDVCGAPDRQSARRLGMQVADSALVRSAFHGADPNWGRVLGALGVAGVPIDQRSVDIDFEGEPICRGGVAVPIDEDALSARMSGDFGVCIRVGDGPGNAVIVTTDLTPDYVRFNSDRS